ncbi:hypothetical protein GLOIN_2v1464113, partial [Rhizophagus irregularis DAOM 181602=DAOM 197198]
KGHSVLFDLDATNFPNSFPLDFMHLIYENIAGYIFKLWTGNFFQKGYEDNKDYVLDKAIWNEIGNNMNNVRKTIPAYLGRPPRNIVLYYNGYKAEEWFTWITLYSLPLLKDRMPIRNYEGWANFVKAVRLCNKLVLTSQDIKNI